MRHDYDLPPDWEELSDEQRDQWFKQERARRMARRQAEAGLHTQIEIDAIRARLRRANRAKGFSDVTDNR